MPKEIKRERKAVPWQTRCGTKKRREMTYIYIHIYITWSSDRCTRVVQVHSFFCFSISRRSVSRVNLTIACVADLSLSRVKCISDGISFSRRRCRVVHGCFGRCFSLGTGGRSSRVCHLFLACVRVASTRIRSLVSAGHGQQGNT